MQTKTSSRFLPLFAAILIFMIGCGGGSEPEDIVETPDPEPPGCVAGQPVTASYTLNWVPVADDDLTGYKVYFGQSSQLTSQNADSNISVGATTTSVEFNPQDFNYTTCLQIYFGVTAIGSRPESALSDIESIILE